MNLQHIFNHDAEKALGRELAERLGKQLPPQLISKRSQILSANKISRLLEQVFDIAKDYDVKNGLSFVRRAILANSFKWELDAKGYPKEFIDLATEGLIVELAKARTTAKNHAV